MMTESTASSCRLVAATTTARSKTANGCTMATLVNQTSNISALGPQFQKLLSVSTNGDDENVEIGSMPIDKKKERAKTFLSSLEERTKAIDGQLQTATDHILPPTRDAKTVTELAELCRLTQHATREKLAILKRRLQEAGYRVGEPTADRFVEHLPSPSPTFPRNTVHRGSSPLDKGGSDSTLRLPASPFPDDEQTWPLSTTFAVVGGPLESVLEADVETDGATTPGSFLSPLPSATDSANAKRRGSLSAGKWHRAQSSTRRKASIGTPTTPPAMDSFSFSSSTNNFLQHIPFEQNDDGTDHQQDTKISSGDRNSREINNTQFGRSSQAGPLKSPKLTPLSKGYQNRRKSPYHNTADQSLLDNYHQFLPPHRVLNFEFREEDDMITLDTQSTMTRNTAPSPATSQLKRHSTSPATTASVSAASATTTAPTMEGRSQFLARMEGMLDRVEESILEDSYSADSSFSKSRVRFFQGDQASRPSDEINASLWRHNTRQTMLPRSPVATNTPSERSKGNNRREKSIRSTNSPLSLSSWGDRRKSIFGDMDGARCDDDDDTETYDDDSTNVVATIVKDKQSGTASQYANQTHHHSSTTERPTHILVESGLASPAHTNITMDNTMIMNAAGLEEEEILHQEQRRLDSESEDNTDEEDNDSELDNLSILTPVLDRYRVEPGGNTIKVIPNQRRPHPSHDGYKNKQLGRKTLTSRRVDTTVTTAFRKTADPQWAGFGKEMDGITPVASNVPTSTFLSPPPTATQPLVTSRKKKVYRKTPLPKNYRSMDLTVGENDHPNLSTASSTVTSPQPFKTAGAFVVPPLRPRSFEARRTPKTSRHQTDPTSMTLSSVSSSSLARAQQQWELQDVDRVNILDSTNMPSGRTNPVGIRLSQQNSSSLND